MQTSDNELAGEDDTGEDGSGCDSKADGHEESDEASLSEYDSEPPYNEELWKKVPWFCRERPKITDWVYDCPNSDCPFTIDLRELGPVNKKGECISMSLFSEELEDEALELIYNHHVEHVHKNGVHFHKTSDHPLKAVLEPWPLNEEST
ncbi:hypothetical protein AAF712_011621 [Marasmius tenuissimus]|uniref:Uncharacterized protein n=1 Tax=Marasmius tenuissimus TaxID=585030 RepID=A0ABR2ZK04_9AGAR|nr:hypothetical protein PM082_022720 [Marasmius tenuissimus]